MYVYANRTGRIDMLRSAPFSDNNSKDIVETHNEVDEDLKYFREDYKLL